MWWTSVVWLVASAVGPPAQQVSEYVPEIVQFIEDIIKKGLAYGTDSTHLAPDSASYHHD
jgi:cysteinyl-tRNA synthetase